MGDWVAIEATTDRRSRARQLARAHDRMASDAPRRGSSDALVRPVIQRSWQRSQAAGISPGQSLAPLSIDTGEAERRWQDHPLAVAVPILRGLLDDVGDQDHVALVCDVDGSLLWLDGRPALVEQAKEVHLAIGSNWSEQAAGTNAMGTALAERHPVQVFSAEHFSTSVHTWTCSAAPVRDPATGNVLGVIDLTGDLRTAHPHSLAVVAMAARMIERELELRVTAPVAEQPAVLRVLGRERGLLRVAGRELELSRRHTEILLLLWLHEEGLNAEQLALELYGEQGRPGSVRAELHRLRAQLGALIGERPYRLLAPLRCDLTEIESLIERGAVAQALADYNAGPALSHTEVPRLTELRDRIDDGLRAAVLQTGDPALLQAWLRTPCESATRKWPGRSFSTPR